MEMKIMVAVIVLAVVLLVILLASGYVKAPPDIAYIISGFKKEPKILIGRAGIRIPFLERKDNLIVKQISVDIKTNGYIPTLDFIGVDIDAVAKIRVKTDENGIKLAMKNFLNMDEKHIIQALTDSLQGNMREIIGTVELKELCTNRKKFGDEVQSKAQLDMNALGIEIISCNIQRIDDEKGLIVALGQDNMSQIQKDASIAKAQHRRAGMLPLQRQRRRRLPMKQRFLPIRILPPSRMNFVSSRQSLRKCPILNRLKRMRHMRFKRKHSVRPLR